MKTNPQTDTTVDAAQHAADVQVMPADRVAQFKPARTKCLQDQFNIVLMGEFSGGQSTTFDAFCGGREISPRGIMRRTSACCISATNLADRTAEEYAEIEWKSEGELIATMRDVLKQHMEEEPKDLSLQNENHRNLMREALNKEAGELEGLPVDDKVYTRKEMLRIADIILTFCTSQEVCEVMKNTCYGIGHVSRFATFPANWGRVSSVAEFAPKEVLFAFVKSIHCHIHSPHLERLGCTVVDCPGHFVSSWDTKVAQLALEKADAVLYLLNGERLMSKGDLIAISEIREYLGESADDKLFIALNRKRGMNYTKVILNEDLELMSNAHIPVRKDNVGMFNALLFFLAEMGDNKLKGSLDAYSETRFDYHCQVSEIEGSTFNERWTEFVGECLHDNQIRKVDVKVLAEGTPAAVKEASGANILLDKIERFILNGPTKAYSKVMPALSPQTIKEFSGDEYHAKRTELIGIVDNLLAVQGLPADRVAQFKRARTKCLQDQFNIVLIGEFQGGKSTTFDAFCGGREISPRGAMIKTSACCISATNLADRTAEEYAEIEWKSEGELIATMRDVLKQHMEEEPKDLSLQNENHRNLMREALNKEAGELEGLPLDDKVKTRMDMLRIADIILTFCTSQEVCEVMKNTCYGIGHVSRFATFPANWSKVSSVAEFAPKEVLFAFVKSIHCHIHSPHLERLGCTVVDCPGLFASSWDTKVAQLALEKADAVLYLLSGERAMTNGDIIAISEIRRHLGESADDKLFFALNRKSGMNQTKVILDEDLALMSNAHIPVRKDNVDMFNALLFFLAEMGDNKLKGSLDAYSETRFDYHCQVSEIKGSTFDERWTEFVGECLNSNKIREVDVEVLAEGTPAAVKEASGANILLDKIERFILNGPTKAYSILVSGGSESVRNGVEAIENELRQKEALAALTEAEHRNRLNRTREACEAFSENAGKLSKVALDGRATEPMMDKCVEVAFTQNIHAMAVSLQLKLLNYASHHKGSVMGQALRSAGAGVLRGLGNLVNNIFNYEGLLKYANGVSDEHKKKLEDLTTAMFGEVVDEIVAPSLRSWLKRVYRGEERTFRLHMLPALETFNENIHREWEKACQQADMLKAVELEQVPLSFEAMDESAQCKKLQPDNAGKREWTKGAEMTRGAVLLLIEELSGKVALGAGFLSWLGAVFVDPSGTALLTFLVALLVWWLVSSFATVPTCEAELSKRQKQDVAEIEIKLRESFSADRVKEKKRLKPVENSFINTIMLYTNAVTDSIHQRTNKIIAELDASFRKSQAERAAIAAAAKKKREEELEPISHRLVEFENGLRK